jgi:hypothetical protein
MTGISVEPDPPPAVRALANDLAARLSEPAFATLTEGLRGVVSVEDADTPQAVTVNLAADRLELTHGRADDADLRARCAFAGAERDPPELDGGDEHPALAEWALALLQSPAPDWEREAERFWSILSRLTGAPEALLVVERESDAAKRLGATGGRAYEIHGSAAQLAAVLGGRVPLIEAAFDGVVHVRGTFPELSVLTGAGYEARYGGATVA